jgi:hypothetical protein
MRFSKPALAVAFRKLRTETRRSLGVGQKSSIRLGCESQFRNRS